VPGKPFPIPNHPPRNILMGGRTPDEPQRWCVMGVSHDHNTLGPPDHLGISLIAKGKPLPKRDRTWECIGGREYYSGPQLGLNIILPFTMVI